MILWILVLQFRNLKFNEEYLLIERGKNAFALLLYSKILTMTSMSIGSLAGTITSLIVNDIAMISNALPYIMIIPTLILVFPGTALILYSLVGWVGLISLAIFLLLTPLSYIIS